MNCFSTCRLRRFFFAEDRCPNRLSTTISSKWVRSSRSPMALGELRCGILADSFGDNTKLESVCPSAQTRQQPPSCTDVAQGHQHRQAV
jgi:hypothetical protein